MRLINTSTAIVKALQASEQTLNSGRNVRISSNDMRHLISCLMGMGSYLGTICARMLSLKSRIVRATYTEAFGNFDASFDTPASGTQPTVLGWPNVKPRLALLPTTT